MSVHVRLRRRDKVHDGVWVVAGDGLGSGRRRSVVRWRGASVLGRLGPAVAAAERLADDRPAGTAHVGIRGGCRARAAAAHGTALAVDAERVRRLVGLAAGADERLLVRVPPLVGKGVRVLGRLVQAHLAEVQHSVVQVRSPPDHLSHLSDRGLGE